MNALSRFSSALLLAGVVAGCTTTTIPRSTLPARSARLNVEAVQGGGASIMLRSQTEPISAEYFTITRDSLFWVDSKTERAGASGFTDLGSFTISDRNAGFILGSFSGTIIGYGAGLLASGPSDNVPALVPVFGFLIGGLVGGLVGIPHTYVVDLSR